MSSPAPRAHAGEGVVLRGGAHAELVALADAVLGPGARHEVALLDLPGGPGEGEPELDVVWAGPDDVSRLHHAGELAPALELARVRLRAGGLVVLPAPEPAELKTMHAVAPVAVQLGVDGTAGPVGVWDFTAGGPRTYSCHLLELRRADDGWTVRAGETTWFEVPTEPELRTALEGSGFLGVQRLSAGETGLSCAVWAAVAPSATRATGG